MLKKRREFKEILVVRNDRFGEFLLNIPAMRALKEAYPQARLSLAVNSAVCELAGLVECVDKVFIWDEIRKNLRKYKFDLCVVLNPTKEAHWAAFGAGIPLRVGYDRKWGFLLTHKLKDTKQLGNRHEVGCNLELVGLIGAKTLDKTLAIKVDDNLFREFILQDRGQSPPATDASAGRSGTVPFLLVAIHPFTSDPLKQWPVERFKELAKKIAKELKAKVVLVGRTEVGTPPYRNGGCPAFCRRTVPSDDGIIDMINKTSLLELAALLKRCALLISCDSGPVHLAASVGTPVVALFRNDLPGKTAQRWGPWRSGRHRLNGISHSIRRCTVPTRVLRSARPN